jgi:hypothetical protein
LAHCCPEPMRRHVRSWPDLASSSQYVREGQRIAALDAEVDALQRQALALGAGPTYDIEPRDCQSGGHF